MATTYTDCITFTGETSDFTLKATSKTWDGTLEWSTDHTNWTILTGREEMQSVNKKLYLRGKGNTAFFYEDGDGGAWGVEWRLSSLAKCNGNIQTLLDYSNPPASIPANSCYRFMFNGCSNLTTAPELPATTLADSCYSEMFYGCTSLTTAPELPATTLASSCYFFMFYGCTSLTQAPSLPANTLADWCYYGMFLNCTSLTTAPKLPATTLAGRCYYNMFKGCTSLKISATQSPEYPTAWRIPSSGTISSTATNWNLDMLSGTGGTFTAAPSINTTYYGAWTVVETYNISYNLTNCTGASSNPTTIDGGTTATLSFTSNDGYSFPDTITVSGVESYTWDKSTGTLTLTNATGDVSITITCIVAYPKINSFTYYGKQINNINGKPIRYVHHSGNTYEMVYLDPNANYLRDANGYVLQDSDGNYLEFTEALATPQNVTANGTTVSWDAVENATSYAVLADGNEIGTVEGSAADELAGTWVFKDSFIDNLGEIYVNFTSFNTDFISIKRLWSGGTIGPGTIPEPSMNHMWYRTSDNSLTTIFQGEFNGPVTWTNEAYKTITITSKLSEVTNGDALLAWLQASATKQ